MKRRHIPLVALTGIGLALALAIGVTSFAGEEADAGPPAGDAAIARIDRMNDAAADRGASEARSRAGLEPSTQKQERPL